MALVLLSGNELRLLGRWSKAVQAAGHEGRIEPLSSMHAANGRGAIACLVDLGPRGISDFAELLQAVVSNPDVHFVALTARPDAAEGLTLLRAGVRGYCNRLARPDVLDAVLSSVLGGEIWAGPQVTEHLLATALATTPKPPSGAAVSLEKLTPREVEIAGEVAAGHSNKVIAVDQGISERTVKAHLNSIFRKTGLRNRVQLALAINRAEPGEPRRSNG